MPHKFDTGLAKPQRTMIREGVVARLAPLLKSAGGYLATIVELPKPVRNTDEDSDDRAMLWHFLNGRAPAVGIALGRRVTEISGSLASEGRGTVDVYVYVASQHGRDFVRGRLSGDVRTTDVTLDPGIEIMLEHVEQLLLGHSLEDGEGDALASIGELRSVDEDEVGTAADLTVWEQRYEIDVERVINPARDITQLLLSIQGNHQEDAIPDGLPAGALDVDPLITIATLSPEEP